MSARKKTPQGRLGRGPCTKTAQAGSKKNLGLVAKALLVTVGAHTLLPLVLIDFCFPAFL